MITYIIRRILYSIPVLFVSTFASFVFVSYASNPLAELRGNQHIPPNTFKLLIIQNHLNIAVPLRYFYWLKDAILHKLGSSLQTGAPLWPDVHAALGTTAQLVIIAETLAITVGCAVGIYSAIRQYSIFDYSFTTLSFLGFALPTFWLAVLLQQVFVIVFNDFHVRIFYTSGQNNAGITSAWGLDRLQHIALPVITLATVSFALYSRYMRAAMLDVINSDYVRTARAKGLSERRVILRHVLPNALIPIVTVTALNIGGLLGGAVVTETVFTLSGFGHYFIEELGQADAYAVMAYLVVTSIIIIAFNLLADILYGVLDPRIRYE